MYISPCIGLYMVHGRHTDMNTDIVIVNWC